MTSSLGVGGGVERAEREAVLQHRCLVPHPTDSPELGKLLEVVLSSGEKLALFIPLWPSHWMLAAWGEIVTLGMTG